MWLLGFYLFFHLWLNMLAEITRFGDRLFYRDWWNARTIEAYWRNWNLPVHHWMLRHLYYPLTRLGVSKSISTFLVFAVSAALHEVIISTPFRILSFHAFFGMLAQVPLISPAWQARYPPIQAHPPSTHALYFAPPGAAHLRHQAGGQDV